MKKPPKKHPRQLKKAHAAEMIAQGLCTLARADPAGYAYASLKDGIETALEFLEEILNDRSSG